MQRTGCRLGRTLIVGLFLFFTILCSSRVWGEIPETQEGELVKEALHREIYGLRGERDKLLREALRINPDFGPARWQLGHLRVRDQWADIDELTANGGEPSPTVRDYVRRREAAQDNPAGQLALADWCRDHKLLLEERAHLSRVLDLNPEHVVAHRRLGHRQVRGIWLTEVEIQSGQLRLEREAAAARRWRGELSEIRRDLEHPQALRRDEARQRLSRIRDVDAIGLMESILSVTGERAALAVVETLATMPDQEATQSLVNHAVLSSFPLVRDAAAEQLRQRKWESFVPAMLNEMYLPVETRFGVAPLANGQLGYRHAFQREGQDEQQQLLLDTSFARVRRATGDGQETLLRAFLGSLLGITQREAAAAQQNLVQFTLNKRLTDTLNIATNQQLPVDPQAWWKWWDAENDQVRQGSKQLRLRQQFQQVSVVDRRMQVATGPAGSQSTGLATRAECFVAGTEVLTRYGARPIESVRVGDLVVAQDIDTGELAFKPVLRTTVRPMEPLLLVQIGQDRLQTSKGHLYWVSGRGWTKARNLSSGQELHCLRGSLPVSHIEESAAAETYNLVVADFHSYFVGTEHVLTHDVTVKSVTDAVVPGLQDE